MQHRFQYKIAILPAAVVVGAAAAVVVVVATAAVELVGAAAAVVGAGAAVVSAAVDAEDKTLVYKNWLGLIKGDLTATITSGNQQVTRSLNPDRQYLSSTGETFSLSGRSLMFIRNVGHLMTTDAILFDDKPIYEGIMDALVTSLIAKHDLLDNGVFKNSQAGSIYIVKPKIILNVK